MSPDEDGPSTVEDQTSPNESTAAPDAGSQTDSSPSSSETPETKGESRESLLEAVTKAIDPEKDGEDGEAAPPRQDGQPPAPAADPGELPAEVSEQELAGYRPKTRRRIEQLIGERQQLRADLEAAQVQANGTSELQKFLKEQDISKDDFGLTLDLASAMRRGDFKAFLDGVGPYVQLAQEALGITIPADLQRAVEAGHMSEDAARWASQLRMRERQAFGQAARFEQQQTEQTDQRAREEFTGRVTQAVTAWEAGVRRRDPDYAAKEPVIRDLLPAVVQERGAPTNEAEAVALAEAAYTRANQMLSRFRPAPQRTQQVPSSISRVNGAVPAPKSLLEAAQQALDRTR